MKQLRRQFKIKRKRHLKQEKSNLVFGNRLREYNYYKNCHQKVDVSNRQRRTSIILPQQFSAALNPDGVLSVLHMALSCSDIPDVKRIFISHEKVKKHDLAAEVMLSALLSSIRSHRAQPKFKNITYAGRFSGSSQINRLVQSIGIVKDFGSVDAKIDAPAAEKIKLFNASGIFYEKKSAYSTDRKTRVTARLVSHIDETLNTSELSLAQRPKSDLRKYIGELLDNAESHSGDSLWHAYAYLDEGFISSESKSEIVVVSYGNSISDTFKEKRNVPKVWGQLWKLVEHHRGKIADDILISISALTHLVSSKKDIDNSRGTGTREVLRLFKNIAEAWSKETNRQASKFAPVLTIITGNVFLQIVAEHVIAHDISDKTKVLPFNDEQDPHLLPSEKYARELKYRFPGTIVSIRFPYTKSLINN